MNREKEFKNQLLKWSKDNTRKYSWRNTKDPWKIYLIEIIAQQTQLDRADQYYKKFIKKWPNLNSLAQANIEDVLTMWSGLGYYSRAKNLLKAAKIINQKHNGIIPEKYEEFNMYKESSKCKNSDPKKLIKSPSLLVMKGFIFSFTNL